MNLVYLILYTFVLALGEAFHQPQALAEQSSLQRKLTNDTQQIELSRCFSGEQNERWQRSSERHY